MVGTCLILGAVSMLSSSLLARSQSASGEANTNYFEQLLGDEDGKATFFEDHFGRSHFLVEDSLRKDRVGWMRIHRQFVRHEDVDSILAKNSSAEIADQPLLLGMDIDMFRIAQEKLGNWGRVKIASFFPTFSRQDHEQVDDDGEGQGGDGSSLSETAKNVGATGPNLAVDHTKVHDAFSDGFELVIHKMESRSQLVQELVENLSSFWMVPVASRLHFMPNNLKRIQQSAPIFHAEDIFLIQLDGEQLVHLYPNAVENPTTTHVTDDHIRAKVVNSLQSMPHKTISLTEGDVLYIPRGYAFDSRTDRKISLHIALALQTHSSTVVDGIRSVIRAVEMSPSDVVNPLLLPLTAADHEHTDLRSVPTYGDLLRMAAAIASDVTPDLRKFMHNSEELECAFDEADIKSSESELDRALGRFLEAAHRSLFAPMVQEMAEESGGDMMTGWARGVLEDGKKRFDREEGMFRTCLEFMQREAATVLPKARSEMMTRYAAAYSEAREKRLKIAITSLRRHGQNLDTV